MKSNPAATLRQLMTRLEKGAPLPKRVTIVFRNRLRLTIDIPR